MKVVIALGGNAILQKGDKGTEEEQRNNVYKSCKQIAKLIEKGYEIVITHGNGPQVGNLLIQQESAKKQVEKMPLDVCDAMTQGQIGYWIQQSLEEITGKETSTIITQVLVDKNDTAFKKPTKPVGPFYEEKIEEGMIFDAGRGYRKVVPSPEPIRTIEIESIKKLLKQNVIVIASGGGGIPIIEEKGKYKGVEAVIDKDRASQVLGNELKSEILIILTAVSNVYLNFHKPNQKALYNIDLEELKVYLKEGHFAEGSMKPKIEAAIKFVEKGGKKAIITSLDKVVEALEGEAGTIITK
ncbi:MAG: carbamate kinase [Candidatus ainarchaeum sp.]|nr:carbamate kinase [Candidatus ainarchaeum sp.]